MTGSGIRAKRFFCLMRDPAFVTLPDFRSNTAFGAETCKKFCLGRAGRSISEKNAFPRRTRQNSPDGRKTNRRYAPFAEQLASGV